ncbi:MAG: hypothetical protein C4539_12230 [Ignavibacteriales bacterium]|nr:MAG: hypothetical protein C4539_12230 [Ignavibacteriales bacterium]
MSRKLKNTLGLVGVLVLIVLVGGLFSFVYQKGKIDKNNKELIRLKKSGHNTEELKVRLKDVEERALVLDSIISKRKFNIPQTLSQSQFYNFVNTVGYSFSEETHVDIEFQEVKKEKDFNFYTYKITGTGEFNDIYRLLYAIEQSKELKKIQKGSLSTSIAVDSDGIPMYLVNFDFLVNVYFADNDRFTTANLKENNLSPGKMYDVFYPLIRNELPPNTEELLEVEGSKLLALLPDGAFISDTKGNTFMLWEGDQVYLGYLTKIDYTKNRVNFILNKGGIIEKVYLELQKEENQKEKIK